MLEELKDAIEFTSKYNKFENSTLLEIREYAEKNKVPIVTNDVAAFISFICSSKNPRNILEIGTAIGYSGLLMLNSSKNSFLTSIERDEKIYNVAKQNLEKNAANRYELINGDAIDITSKLENKFDLIFLDANKSKYKEIFDYVYPKLEKGGIIIIDNVLFRGYVYKDDYPKRYKTIVKNLKKLINYLSENYNAKFLPFGDGICLVTKNV